MYTESDGMATDTEWSPSNSRLSAGLLSWDRFLLEAEFFSIGNVVPLCTAFHSYQSPILI